MPATCSACSSGSTPHWDFDDPLRVARQFPDGMRERVLRDNALELYGLPPTRRADGSA